jgi:hypothetical protein
MPVETPASKTYLPADDSVGAAFIAEARQSLDSALAKIRHCLEQLSEEDVQWRPFESANSIQNIILHLSGNVRQWIVHGIGDVADIRDRAREFSDRSPVPKHELLARLGETVTEADRVLAEFDTQRLTEAKTVQGFASNRLSAIFDSVSHFVGHTHQIVYITRLKRGEEYRFQWIPQGIDAAQPGPSKT